MLIESGCVTVAGVHVYWSRPVHSLYNPAREFVVVRNARKSGWRVALMNV